MRLPSLGLIVYAKCHPPPAISVLQYTDFTSDAAAAVKLYGPLATALEHPSSHAPAVSPPVQHRARGCLKPMASMPQQHSASAVTPGGYAPAQHSSAANARNMLPRGTMMTPRGTRQAAAAGTTGAAAAAVLVLVLMPAPPVRSRPHHVRVLYRYYYLPRFRRCRLPPLPPPPLLPLPLPLPLAAVTAAAAAALVWCDAVPATLRCGGSPLGGGSPVVVVVAMAAAFEPL
mmetsp:Transcript_5346/g.13636  ORF Transcript_5346/g.13636 Transcript_5346/m.13636 type:complete len:230 (+) Transcript_5346:1702-2391(+)